MRSRSRGRRHQLNDGRQTIAAPVAPYKEPEVLRRVDVPAIGARLRLERLSPYLSGPPILRWVAEYKVGPEHHTVESYVQVPHTGFDQLEGWGAEKAIADDVKRLVEMISRQQAAGPKVDVEQRDDGAIVFDGNTGTT